MTKTRRKLLDVALMKFFDTASSLVIEVVKVKKHVEKKLLMFLEPKRLEDLELPHRYRPENLDLLCEATG